MTDKGDPSGASRRVMVNGEALRLDRRRRFPSASALAAVCGASEPTIYRAERGGPVLIPYLRSIAAALGEDVAKYLLSSPEAPSQRPGAEAARAVLGQWLSLTVRHLPGTGPAIREAHVVYEMHGSALVGRATAITPGFITPSTNIRARVDGLVLSGYSTVDGWDRPEGQAQFMVTLGRNGEFAEGANNWFDPQTRQIEKARLIMLRTASPQFEAYRCEALARIESDLRLFRLRKLLESHTIELTTALRLVFPETMDPSV